MTTLLRRAALATSVLAAIAGATARAAAQPAGQPSHVTIPYLANANKPADLDFAAAQCDVSADAGRMDCRFRQVFVTVASSDPTACVITTNGYQQSFRREAPARWVSTDAPSGECGLLETTTLEDGGTTRWTMTIRRVATRNAETPACRAAAAESEVYSWRDIRRKLPCTTIQPGAIER